MSSVGELLDQAEVRARDLLVPYDTNDGRTMLRGWTDLIDGAANLWAAIPAPRQSDSGAPPLGAMDQIADHAYRLERDVRSRAGQNHKDPRFQEIGEILNRAAELIRADGVTRLPTPAHEADSLAARVSIMHTVGVATHAVNVGLRQSLLIQQTTPLGKSLEFRVPTTTLLRRAQVVEDLAHSFHRDLYPEVRGEAWRDPVDPDRLGATISTWDVHARRVLLGEPTARDLYTVADTMAAASRYASTLWRLTAESSAPGTLSTSEHRTQVGPAVDGMADQWARMGSVWETLIHPRQPRSAATDAGLELRTAFGELARDRIGPPTAEVLAARADLGEVVTALGRFQATATGVADAFTDALRRGQVMVNSAAANALVRAVVDDEVARDILPSAVSPRALHLRREHPLPKEAQAALEQVARTTSSGSRRALYATNGVVDQARRQARAANPAPLPPAPARPEGPPASRLRLIREQTQPRVPTTESTGRAR